MKLYTYFQDDIKTGLKRDICSMYFFFKISYKIIKVQTHNRLSAIKMFWSCLIIFVPKKSHLKKAVFNHLSSHTLITFKNVTNIDFLFQNNSSLLNQCERLILICVFFFNVYLLTSGNLCSIQCRWQSRYCASQSYLQPSLHQGRTFLDPIEISWNI